MPLFPSRRQPPPLSNSVFVVLCRVLQKQSHPGERGGWQRGGTPPVMDAGMHSPLRALAHRSPRALAMEYTVMLRALFPSRCSCGG